jgi:hypothetical protein
LASAGAALLLAAVTAGCFASRDEPSEQATLPARSSATTTLDRSVTPKPLLGVPLEGSTGLQLLVATNPPLVLDVDSGRIEPVTGLRLRGNPLLSVLAVGKDAVVVVYHNEPVTLPAADVYVVRHGTTTATRLGTAWGIAPVADGRAVWLLSDGEGRRCALRQVGLDGRERRRPRPAPCSPLAPAGSVGLVVQGKTGESVLDPVSGRTLLRAWNVLAVVGHLVLSRGELPGPLALTDLRSGSRHRLAWPSELTDTDEPAVHPHGRLVAVAFATPAYQGGSTQALDVWLLDPITRRLEQLPDMPAEVALKRTSMTWTSDGRLVMLAETAGRNVVAVWRPGQTRIAVRRVRLPRRNSGSDSFVVW